LALTNQLRWQDALVSIPFGLLTMCIVLANNIRDFDFDRKKIKTLPVVIGLRAAYYILFTAVHLSFASIVFLINIGVLPKLSFLSLLAYPILFVTIKTITSPKFVDVFGVMQAIFCCLLAIGLLNN
jgi:1,4-dihydroxy-2-naphthoate octaprenyltransferase